MSRFNGECLREGAYGCSYGLRHDQFVGEKVDENYFYHLRVFISILFIKKINQYYLFFKYLKPRFSITSSHNSPAKISNMPHND